MADDSHTKTFLQANRLKIDFRGFVLIAVILGIILILLATLWTGLSNFSPSSWWSDEAEGESIQADHIVFTTKPISLTHFVDRNSDGILQKTERAIREVEAGCYQFTAIGPDTVWDHYPNQTYDLGSIVRVNGNDTGHSFSIKEGQAPVVSFDPSFGSGRLIQTGAGGYEVVKITFTPSSGPDCDT